jgi:hypothetical protein
MHSAYEWTPYKAESTWRITLKRAELLTLKTSDPNVGVELDS